MSLYIRLIWDFRGPDSTRMAEHHAKHLNEFGVKENLSEFRAGSETTATSEHAIAFLDVPESLMKICRDALRPQRGIRLSQP